MVTFSSNNIKINYRKINRTSDRSKENKISFIRLFINKLQFLNLKDQLINKNSALIIFL